MSIEGPSDAKPPTKVAWAPGYRLAYVPGRLIVRDSAAEAHVNKIDHRADRTDGEIINGLEGERAWIVVDKVDEPLKVAEMARAEGFEVQPDHVLFAHDCDPCCGAPHPWFTYDALLADPLRGNPLRGNPMRGNPMRGNPMRGNPFVVDPMRGNDAQTSSARPARDRGFPVRSLGGAGAAPRIMVLDTGLATAGQLPQLLNDPNRITGDGDEPTSALVKGAAAVAADTWLDPVAGHGTFIAGLIEQLAPGCAVTVKKVIAPLGDVVESDVVKAITDALDPNKTPKQPDILSLSFGGTAVAQAPALRAAIAMAQLKGVLVVASAGNDGSSEPQYPAAYDSVLAVGALGPDGPAPWTNYGSWVDACAPGTDLVSSFFANFDGPSPEVNTVDPDRFRGWATWSGTSFSAPVVVAALAREMVAGAKTPQEAVERVIHAPYALQIRCLGTVVNA